MYITLPHIIIIFTLTIGLSYIAWKDYKEQEISFIALGAMIVFSVFAMLYSNTFNYLDLGLGVLIGIIPFSLMALTSKGGIGDIFLMGTLGLILGSRGIIYLILLSGLFYLIFGLVIIYYFSKEEKGSFKEGLKKQYPYAPFVLMGWMAYLVIGFIEVVIGG